MAGREADVVGGVNQFIVDQQKNPQEDTISITRFDSQGIEIFRPRAPVAETLPIGPTDFVPRGGTPLLDAVGRTIAQMEEDWKAEKPDRAILLIFTDGEENESREYTKAKIQELIKARQDSGLWAFIYLGAHANAFHEASQLGVASMNTASFNNTAGGTRAAYASVSSTVDMMKTSGVMRASNLGGKIEDDQPNTAKTPADYGTKVNPTPPPTAGAWVPPTAGSGTPSPGPWTPPA